MKKIIYSFVIVFATIVLFSFTSDNQLATCKCNKTLWAYGIPFDVYVTFNDDDCNPLNGGMSNLSVKAYVFGVLIHEGNTGTARAVAHVCGIRSKEPITDEEAVIEFELPTNIQP